MKKIKIKKLAVKQEKQFVEEKRQLHVTQAQICSESLLNASLSVHYLNNHQADIPTLFDNFSLQVDKIIKGDVRRIETMLTAQAQTLDAVFHKMLQRASKTDVISQSQVYMDMAFKAQKQCRQTLSALVEIKHPRKATFIKQQNNAINQQVNNAVKPESKKFKKSQNITNELMEVIDDSVDTRTAIETSTVNSSMETVGISGCKDSEG